MKNLKKLISTITVMGMIAAAGAAYAASTTNAADKKTAAELEEFKTQRMEQMKAVLDQRVKEGKLTQEQADVIYKTMKDNQAACDGTSSGNGQCNGQGMGSGAGRGAGSQGCGAGMGFGRGMNR